MKIDNGKLKIVIATGIFPPDIGGPASYVVALTKRLKDHADVTVVAFSSVRGHAGDDTFAFSLHRVWTRIPWGFRHILFFFKCWFVARGAHKVLLLNASTAGYTGTVAAMLAGVPTVVRVVGDYAWEMAVIHKRTYLMLDDFQSSRKKGVTARFHRMQTWVCRKAERVIVPSNYIANLVAGWGIDREKISVVYNGSDFEPSNMPKEEARKKVGIPGNIILSVGRLVPWKGFRMLIKMMPQLFQLNQFFRLVIVGDGPLMKELASIVRTQGLERKVFLVGRKNKQELAELMAAADVFVLNTGYEGFSHQLLEAMRAGVPVVTTTAGGNRELIEQGENGFMVRHNDEFNLVEAIKSLHRDEAMRRRFIENGYRTAEHYSVERMLRETMNIMLL